MGLIESAQFIGSLGAVVVFVVGVFQWLDLRRREERTRRYEQFHRAFEWVAGRTATGQLLVDTQQAIAVYELGDFPEYKQLTIPILDYYLMRTSQDEDESLFRRSLLATKDKLTATREAH